jgi:hypothetical protein
MKNTLQLAAERSVNFDIEQAEKDAARFAMSYLIAFERPVLLKAWQVPFVRRDVQ